MEITDVVPIQNCDGVTLSGACYKSVVDGTLCMMSHHLILSSRKQDNEELWLLHMAIDAVERKPHKEAPGGHIIIKCKDFRVITLGINHTENFNCIAQSLEVLVNMEVLNYKYAFYYRPLYPILENGWEMFKPELEATKIFKCEDDKWRITEVNENYDVCPTYPRVLVVPSSVPDEDIKEASKFRDLGRFPVLCYRYHTKNSVLMRSSQPLPGPLSKRNKSDERLLNSYLGKSGRKGIIIDTRTQTLAQSAKNKGGGVELEMHYPQWKKIHRPVDKHSILLDSLAKFIEASNDVSCSMDKWISKLDASAWMSNIKEVLSCGHFVAQFLDQEGSSVLVHGSEGLDSTLLITSLVQVMMEPDCRTIRGFQALIEREWLQAGYPFQLRHRYSCYSPLRTKDQSPTFLLFLDCIYQLLQQYVCSFEFSSSFLILLFEHSYFSPYGTFLLNSEQDRVKAKLSALTSSLWSYVNRPEILPSLMNPLYEHNKHVIWPSISPVSLELWRELYLRWVTDQSNQKAAWTAIAQLKQNDNQLRFKTMTLRTQLRELEKQLRQAGLCID